MIFILQQKLPISILCRKFCTWYHCRRVYNYCDRATDVHDYKLSYLSKCMTLWLNIITRDGYLVYDYKSLTLNAKLSSWSVSESWLILYDTLYWQLSFPIKIVLNVLHYVMKSFLVIDPIRIHVLLKSKSILVELCKASRLMINMINLSFANVSKPDK